MPTDGTNQRVQTGEPATNNLEYPSWYPGGGQVAVTNYVNYQLLLVDVQTGNQSPLTDPSLVQAGHGERLARERQSTGLRRPAAQPYDQNLN